MNYVENIRIYLQEFSEGGPDPYMSNNLFA